MRGTICAVLVMMLILFTACGKFASTWQEQYDLGVCYLSEGNYKEAIIAFTAAIEIDPEQAPAYVGRGDAYIFSGDTEDNLSAARADYEKAIELDETLAEAYLELADAYILQGDYDYALEILKKGAEKAENNQKILDKLIEISSRENSMDSIEAEETVDYNVYGATEFTQRKSFKNPEDLSVVEVSFLREALDAVTQDNLEQLDRLSRAHIENFGYNSFSVLTMLDGYKIQMKVSPDHNGIATSLEIRPENGIGYGMYIVNNGRGVSGSYTSCVCVDWQWHGVATKLTLDNGDVYCYDTIPMKKGLRDGAVVTTYPVDSYTRIPEQTVTYYEYQDGVRITDHGTVAEFDNVFWGLTHGISGPLSDQSALDDLYW